MMKKSKSSANARQRTVSKADEKRLIDLTPRKDAKGGTTPILKTCACGVHFPTGSL
jgi:hypothetical protein